MNIYCSRLEGMLFSIVVGLLAALVCHGQQWTGYHYQYHPSTTTQWNQPSSDTTDLLLQDSIRRQSSVAPWQDPRSKPQWKRPMYKPKWQDPYSKPHWQVLKASYSPKPTSKPFKNGWRKQWKPVKYNPTFFRSKVTPAPRMNTDNNWPEYIPPLSVIRPSMDDPHALLNWGR